MNEAQTLREAAQAVLDRWDSPQWQWTKHGPTADLMADLRAALAAPQPAAAQAEPRPVDDAPVEPLKGWKLNHVQFKRGEGTAQIGYLDPEDDRFSPIVTVNTGLYYEPKQALPLAAAILGMLQDAGAAPVAQKAEPMTERDHWDFAKWQQRLGELADAYYQAGRANPARQRARAALMLHATDCATGWRTRSAAAALGLLPAAAHPQQPVPGPLTECNDNDSPWLICKTCSAAGRCAKTAPQRPMTAGQIERHIGTDEGDREAVTAIVREVEAWHGITATPAPAGVAPNAELTGAAEAHASAQPSPSVRSNDR